jgi:hypothetical protein
LVAFRDKEQEEKSRLHDAISNLLPVEVTLRNYRKNGELFYSHPEVIPLFDSNGRILLLGVQYDITTQVVAEQEIKRWNDRLEVLAK